MKLMFFIFLMILSATFSKKKKHHVTRIPSESDVLSDEIVDTTDFDNDEDFESQTRFELIRRQYFSTKGNLRQNFAVELAFQYSSSNVVCSPVSALLPLGKLVFGAESPTKEELYQVIGDYKEKDIAVSFKKLIKELQFVPGVKLDLASRIYISDQADLLANFHKDVKEIFGTSVEKISFTSPKQAADEINGWVSRQTNGMIPLLMQPSQIPPLATLVIVNAIYFKGKWKYPFDRLEVRDFFAPSGQKKTQMMKTQAVYKYTKSDILNAQIIEIPYEEMEAVFVIVLPNERVGLPLLLNQLKLAPSLLNNAMRNFTAGLVELTIPKFSISTSLDLKDMYEKIGVKHMTGPRTGLTGIVKGQTLAISTAVQKAVIEVHERGTEAAAASAIVAIPLSFPVGKFVKIVADHPFLFYIQANTEQLFAGIFSEP